MDSLGEHELAYQHRVIALSLESKSWTLEGFADTLYHLKKYKWSCAVWAQAVLKDPRDARYCNRWGDALFQLKEYERAAEKYREAVRVAPQKGSYWDDLGDCLRRLGQKEQMFQAYQRAAQAGWDDAWADLGWCYYGGLGVKQNYDKAFQMFKHYAEVTRKAYGYYRMANCYYSGQGVEKDFHKAIGYYEKALKISPHYGSLLMDFAWVLTKCDNLSLRDYSRAIQLAKESLAINENEEILETLALAYFRNKQYPDAVRMQERLIQLWKHNHPDQPVPEGKQEELEKYKKAMQNEPQAATTETRMED